MMRRIAAGLVAAGLFSVGAEASAQSYTRSSSSRTYSSISLTGSYVSLSESDEGYGSFSAPFSFTLYGATVSSGSTLYVGANGTLHLDSGVGGYTNEGIPSSTAPNGYVAPFWDDLVMTNGGVYYETQGAFGSRVLVVEWNNAANYNATSDRFSFQLRISETTNVVEFHYGPRTVAGVWDGTIGIENSTGFDGVAEICSPSCTPSSVPASTVVTLTPSGGGGQADFTPTFVTTPPASAQEGGFFTLDYEIYNGGTVASPGGDISLFVGASPTVTTADYELAYSSFSAISSGQYGYGTFNITVPSGFAGTWYIAAIVDPYASVSETSETNNSYNLGSITITGQGGGSIVVTTTSLPGGQIGSSYSAQLQQSGASFPFWSIVSGSLPTGLSMSTDGWISGSPSSNGFFSFRVQASESGLTPGTADLSINVGGGGTIQIVTTSLDPAEVGVPYTGKVEATGGVPPYAFQIIQGRPDWLLLDSAGNFSGTPAVQGSHQLTISVFDSNFADASAILTLDVVQPQALSIDTELPSAVTNREYFQKVVSGGVPPYQLTITDGELPAGLSMDDAGNLTGVPTAKGEFSFTLGASDSNTPQGYVQQQLAIDVVELTELEITVGREVQIYVKSDVDQPLNARGGVPPYQWSIAVGQLVPGLSLTSDGHLIGRVEQVGSSTVTFVVSDSEGSVAQAETIVRATVYRPMDTRDGGGGRRRGGCACMAQVPQGSLSPVAGIGLIGLALIGARRVQRRRGNARSAAPH
jgi:hypothetical protein